MKTLEIKETPGGRAIFVDGELFDWGLEEEDLKRAKEFSETSLALRKSIHGDIQRHFLDSFAEFIGKAVSLRELNEAIESGCIDA